MLSRLIDMGSIKKMSRKAYRKYYTMLSKVGVAVGIGCLRGGRSFGG